MLKLVFFVPESHKDAVKHAVFEHGAGRYDGYDCCSWEVLGTGQFKPLSGSQPFIGQHNQIETVAEYRVEMICDELHIKAVLQALINAHPYETPAYDVQVIQTLDDF
ncbi:MAG: NGG1p interacting factor NIF3 [Piscirickettsiaceae bacterium]|nr:NGG1p interacting factor NIF3 [Piscirickettsiaceae bacterium]